MFSPKNTHPSLLLKNNNNTRSLPPRRTARWTRRAPRPARRRRAAENNNTTTQAPLAFGLKAPGRAAVFEALNFQSADLLSFCKTTHLHLRLLRKAAARQRVCHQQRQTQADRERVCVCEGALPQVASSPPLPRGAHTHPTVKGERRCEGVGRGGQTNQSDICAQAKSMCVRGKKACFAH